MTGWFTAGPSKKRKPSRPIFKLAQTKTDFELLPVVPIDDDTRAMLAYAASPQGRAHIDQAHRELQEGKGIMP